MALSEFEIIQHYFSNINFHSSANGTVVQGAGDDSAIIHIPDTHDLVFSIDTQLEGVHFPAGANAGQIAQRAFRCAISDLAAMGATPFCFTLALTIPAVDSSWLQSFSEGLQNVAQEFSCSLVGGDTTKGPLAITLQVHGTLPKGKALKRSAAKVGDVILVSGYLGNSAAYVDLLHEKRIGQKELAHAEEIFMQDYFYPQPRIVLGRALLNYSQCAIDISDGLLADLGHICRASGVSAAIHLDKLPLSPELSSVYSRDKATQMALTGGDDYQLCFTVSETKCRKIASICEDMECPTTVIGTITESAGSASHTVTCYDKGQLFDTGKFTTLGYTHF